MSFKRHPDYPAIFAALKSLLAHAQPLEGVWYRCVDAEFADEIVSGAGARLHGGRWNAIGSFPTVYLSNSPEIALQEYLARARRMKWPDHKALPMVMAGVSVKAARVLPLAAPAVAAVVDVFLNAEKTHWRAIQSRREAASQAVGRAVREADCHGLIAPSQQVPGGLNAVLFPDQFGRGDKLSAPKLKPIKG